MSRRDVEKRTTGWRAVWLIMFFVLMIGLLPAFWLTLHGLPCPLTDDAAWKSPAAELAQNHRLWRPSYGENSIAGIGTAYYFCLGLWYSLFSVSVRSSLAFTCTVHLIHTALVIAAAARIFGGCVRLSDLARNVLLGAIGLISLANVICFDRVEEFAMVWIWAEVLATGNRWLELGLGGRMRSGVLVGVAAVTSPWAGLLGAILVVARAFFAAREAGGAGRRVEWKKSAAGVFAAGATAAAVVGAWWLGLDLFYGGEFSRQVFRFSGYVGETQVDATAATKILHFAFAVWYLAPQIPTAVVTIVFFPASALAGGGRRLPPEGLALYATGVFGVIFIALVRSAAYHYLWPCLYLLLPCFFPAMAHFLERDAFGKKIDRAKLSLAGLAIAACLAFAWQDVARLGLLASRLPRQERADEVFARLRKIIPPRDKVAVTYRHWHAFQGRNRWHDAVFSALMGPETVLDCDWLVLPVGIEDRPQFYYIDCFELVETWPTEVEPIRAHRHTYAYSLWRRRPPEGGPASGNRTHAAPPRAGQ